MDTITPVPAWDDLTTAQQFHYAGNLDPWAGPVDPVAQARELARFKARQNPRDVRDDTVASPCGCWALDCAECGPRLTSERPPKRHRLRWQLRQDAAHLKAKTSWAVR